jgi:hypothetical protein
VSRAGQAPRRPQDFYPTPGWVTRAILPVLAEDIRRGVVWEPAAGDGAILRELVAFEPDLLVSPRLVGTELIGERARVARVYAPVVVGDFFHSSQIYGCSLIITNPPYSYAERFVGHAIDLAGEIATVAMLLRLAFLETQRRAAFVRRHCPDVYVLPERPSFVPGPGRTQTDSCAYAWMVWPRGDKLRSSGRIEVLAPTAERDQLELAAS